MRAFRLLVLTDHSGHSAENSIYPLLKTMKGFKGFSSIDVASRGVASNLNFFNGIQGSKLHAATVTDDFHFDPDGACFAPAFSIDTADAYDGIFLRLPPPAQRHFFDFLTDWAGGSLIFNHPKGILETSSKAFLLNFKNLSPPMKLCHNLGEIMEFARQFPIVLKPLYYYGGKGIVKISGQLVDTGDTTMTFEEFSAELTSDAFPFLAMKFLENVHKGDKRILVVKGEVLGASLRLPAQGSWLCNVARGGSSVSTEPSVREMHMASQLSGPLLEHGILIFGFDTLEDGDGIRYLSEINTMSIGGMPQMEAQTGRPILQRVTKLVWEYLNSNMTT